MTVEPWTIDVGNARNDAVLVLFNGMVGYAMCGREVGNGSSDLNTVAKASLVLGICKSTNQNEWLIYA